MTLILKRSSPLDKKILLTALLSNHLGCTFSSLFVNYHYSTHLRIIVAIRLQSIIRFNFDIGLRQSIMRRGPSDLKEIATSY